MIKVKNHRLQQNNIPFPFVRSPNQSAGRTIRPEYLVIHYTAGRSAESSVRWLTSPEAKASAHLVIGRDGGVTQLVAFDRRAWHAGVSQWEGRSGLNSFSIGIELDNMGVLDKTVDDSWHAWFGARVPDDEVLEARHGNESAMRGWHTYTEVQLESALEVASALVSHYGLKGILGHSDIAPGRKQDPGPAFPMERFQARLAGREDEQEEDSADLFLTKSHLNIRTGPGTSFPKLDVSPLPPKTRLVVLGENGIWRRVDVLDTVDGDMDIEGWVHGRHIQRA